MCEDIPDPPANIDVDEEAGGMAQTTRDYYDVLTGEGTCGAACHVFLNPPGFAFEHFDAVGVWRDSENGVPVDSAVDLSSLGLEPVDGAMGLGHAIADSEKAKACFANKSQSQYQVTATSI